MNKELIDLFSMDTMKKIIMTVARVASHVTIEKMHLTKSFLSQSQAYRIYGRGNVQKWIEMGLITPRMSDEDSNRKKILISELEAVLACENIFKYEMERDNKRFEEQRQAGEQNYPGWEKEPY